MTATAPEKKTQPAPSDVASGDTPALHVQGLWKIFGPRADKIIGTPDADLSRSA